MLSKADNNYLYINSGTSGHNPVTIYGRSEGAGPSNSPNPGQGRSTTTPPVGEKRKAGKETKNWEVSYEVVSKKGPGIPQGSSNAPIILKRLYEGWQRQVLFRLNRTTS